ncbi:unnamed protein product [Spirodela intermedia]|uniref:Uncharacterized protein n=1 Tax=Spirodela intermedia TaxID=51605 RepID=A0A7I8K3I5_SPIIN|nr:unnamed protein product [Spirodela intermedia]
MTLEDLVKDLIEYCLQLYMNQKEVIQTLELNAHIEPGFTELVWQKLEEENTEFFKAYNFRLKVKNQITMFNQLLQKQVDLMHGMCSSSAAAVSLSSESNSSLQQTPCYTSAPSRPDNISSPVGASTTLINGGPPLLQNMRINDTTSLSEGRMNLPTSLLSTTSSQMTMLHRMNGTGVKLEPGYSGTAEFMFHTNNDFCQERPTVGDPTLPSFMSPVLDAQSLNGPLLDTNASSFGGLGQIPQNFGFSDLAADFNQSTDLLESFGGSLFLSSDFNGLSTLSGRKCEA